MTDDLYFYYTQNLYNNANVLMAKVENLQRVSNNYQNQSIVFSNNKNPDLNVYMTQEEFDYKYELLNKFLNDIFNSNKKVKKNKSKPNKRRQMAINKDNSSIESFFKDQSNISSSSNYNIKTDENDNNSVDSFNNFNVMEIYNVSNIH